MAATFFWCLIVLLTLEYVGNLILSTLNRKFILSKKGQVPAFLAGELDPERAAKSADYSAEKLNFAQIRTTVELLVVFTALFIGFFGRVDDLAHYVTAKPVWQGLIFFAVCGFAQYLVGLPFSLYSTFVIEKKYGFNRTTPFIYFTDQLKGFLVAAVLAIPLYAAIHYFFEASGTLWWVYAWAIMLAFSLIITWVFPEYIAPLFNKFSTLEDVELRKQIDALSEKTGFNLTRVQVMDASKRSNHSNAYFTGFGKTKKIVLFDTLLKQTSKDGIISVLAHELGHFKLKHIIRKLIVSQVLALISLGILAFLAEQSWFYEAFKMERSLHGALLAFTFLSGAIGFWWTPLASFFSRKHEFEADEYAVTIVGTGRHLKEALIGLTRENLTAPQPHPLYSKFFYSHPPIAERLEAIDRAQLNDR